MISGPYGREAEEINKRLKDHFGQADSGDAIFRIVFSEDQFEKQLTEYTAEGLQLLYPEWREVPKYRQWIHQKYILERLVAVPAINSKELTVKVSYEPLRVFERGDGTPLPPKWEAAKFTVDLLYHALGKENMWPKYMDPGDPPEAKEARLKQLQEELFGNETEVGDALAHKQGVALNKTDYLM